MGKFEEKPNSRHSRAHSHLALARQVDYRTQHLSIAQRIQILSRRDRMGRLNPGILRLCIAIVLVLAILIVGAQLQDRSLASAAANRDSLDANEVRLTFTGDMMLGRYVDTYGEKEGYDKLFDGVRALWKDSSLVFTNLECAVLPEHADLSQARDKLVLHAEPAALEAAVAAGVNAFSVANNHIADYGRENLANTLSLIEASGAAYAGAGANWDECAAYRVLDADGLKVGFVACTDIIPSGFAAQANGYGVNTFKNSRTSMNILKASMETDLVVVYIHWGKENQIGINDRQREMAHLLVEAGADIVIGSHPHVLQEVEQYQGATIFYSLGNFLFDQAQRPTRVSAMVQLTVNRETGKGRLKILPLILKNFHPYLTDSTLYTSMVRRSMTAALSANAYSVTGDGQIEIPVQFNFSGKS